MNTNLKGELTVMDSLGIKPNYAALGRKYELDWRTVKKYHNGYQGKPATRNKGSKLDSYKTEIADKLTIKRITVRGVYEFMVKNMELPVSDHILTLTDMYWITSSNQNPIQMDIHDLKENQVNRDRLTGRKIFLSQINMVKFLS